LSREQNLHKKKEGKIFEAKKKEVARGNLSFVITDAEAPMQRGGDAPKILQKIKQLQAQCYLGVAKSHT